MRIAIIGLPASGRTTLFNALTRGRAQTGPLSGRDGRVGVARVPDQRLTQLANLLQTPTSVQVEVVCVDLPETRRNPGRELFSGERINQLQQVDALLAVVRAFDADDVPHVAGSIDWRRDLEELVFEVTFADVALIERRIERINESMKGMRSAQRDAALNAIRTFQNVQARLEDAIPVRAQNLTAADDNHLQGAFLLSALPFLAAVNVNEGDLDQSTEIESALSELLNGPRTGGAPIAAGLEMELAQMDEQDEADMRSGLQAGESGLSRIVRLAYDVLGLISFYTANDKEVRAWSIPTGTIAPRAAGAVHTDMERGFIRAEVVSCDRLLECGSFVEARKRGALRQEGRNYEVNDGDVINFLFSV